MLNRSASLAMSTSVLKALPGKLDIKRHSPCILYLQLIQFTITLQANEMIGNIRNAFNELINDLDWMDEETKKLAREKVEYSIRIGNKSYITSRKELSGNDRSFFLPFAFEMVALS